MFSYRCMHIVCSKPTLNKSIPTACCTLIFAFSLLFFLSTQEKITMNIIWSPDVHVHR